MDKNTEQDIGRSAEVEARQGEDGTFELVVSDSAAHAVVSEEAAQSHRDAESAALPESAVITPERLKRVGLIVLLIALIAGGLIYALSGPKEEPTDTARASQARSDGFQPYEGGGAAGVKAGGASQNETLDRLKAADRDDDERGVDPRPEPLEARVTAQPSSSGRNDDEEPADEDEWELSEAELLEEARAVESAEKAAEKERKDSNRDDDQVDEIDEEQDEGETGQEEDREVIKERGRRIIAPKLERAPASRLKNRFKQIRPAKKRPPLRGLRGLQRGVDQDEQLPADEPGGEEEGYWNEGEEEDRVPEFGRD